MFKFALAIVLTINTYKTSTCKQHLWISAILNLGYSAVYSPTMQDRMWQKMIRFSNLLSALCHWLVIGYLYNFTISISDNIYSWPHIMPNGWAGSQLSNVINSLCDIFNSRLHNNNLKLLTQPKSICHQHHAKRRQLGITLDSCYRLSIAEQRTLL